MHLQITNMLTQALDAFRFTFGSVLRLPTQVLGISPFFIPVFREKLCRPSIHEWFQWLSERMSEYPEYRDEEGAYSKYLRWKPEKGTGSRQKEGA